MNRRAEKEEVFCYPCIKSTIRRDFRNLKLRSFRIMQFYKFKTLNDNIFDKRRNLTCGCESAMGQVAKKCCWAMTEGMTLSSFIRKCSIVL